MWALLQWLYDRASRVFEFLGSLYYKIRDAALYAWDWIQQTANDTFWKVYNWITYWYDRAVMGAKALVQGVTDLAWHLWGRAVQAAKDLVKIVEYEFWHALAVSSQAARDLIKITEYNLFKTLTDASIASQNLIKVVEYNVFKTLNDAAQNLTALVNQANDAVDAVKKNIGLDDPERMNTLTTFLNNPLSWFAAYLIGIILIALEYSVAIALGTEEAILPPAPDFSVGGAGGPVGSGPGPPPGAAPLAPPLDHLYLSGFRYDASHRGSDFGCTTSSTLYACHSGRVVVAGWSNVGYGNYVIIQGSEWWSLYGHLSQIGVAVGQVVSTRQPIGLCGCTGNSSCNHLHLELKHYGQFVDPVLVFGVGG